jgi:ATP-binding cassette, subfamily B, bacterial MsbA
MAKDLKAKAETAAPAKVAVFVGTRAILGRIFRENIGSFKKEYSLIIFCLLIVAVTTGFAAWIMRDVIDQIFYSKRADLIGIISLSIMAAFFIRGIASYIQAVAMARVGNAMVARYQKRLFAHLMTLGFDFYSSNRSAQLAARIAENIGGIRDVMSVTISAFARDLVTLIGLVAVMIIQDPVLSLSSLIIGPPLLMTVAYVMRRVRAIARQAVEVNSRLLGAMQETVQGMTIVKAFTMEKQLEQKLEQLVSLAENRANKIAAVSERTGPVAEMLAGFAVAGVVAYGGYRALHYGQSPGATFSFITALLLAYDPARRLARLQVTLERALVNARMVYEILDMPAGQAEKEGDVVFKPAKGEIEFKNISFGYQSDMPVLQDLNFTAKGGKTLALVGPSGAGKSTIVSLVLGFHKPQTGQIMIDGQDLAVLNRKSLRGSIAYVSQQPYMFEGTVRDNIRYGRPEATDTEVEDAARLAEADEFIRAMPLGYDTPLGENGSTVSGGQRQRLSIARAIVRNAPILLLDEATSALDTESERKVQIALEGLMKNRTTIVIAHRLSTIKNADTILVMDQGRIVESGTHPALLKRKNGIYARLNATGALVAAEGASK